MNCTKDFILIFLRVTLNCQVTLVKLPLYIYIYNHTTFTNCPRTQMLHPTRWILTPITPC